ncbi:MAG TPA: hypothetical protein DDW55_09185, partial [Gammaproteobacteria bacterium]|nr:hypothetical protein [Gammaproteobacteria bacterium]
MPKENKGLKSLAFLKVDATINAETESLAFLNLYLNAFQGMKLDGSGHVNGRIHMKQGKLEPGTDLIIAARELGMDLMGYRVEGDGTISVDVPKDNPDNHIGIEFDSLEAFDVDGQTTLFSGSGLAVNATGNTVVVPLDGLQPKAKSIAVSIPSVKVPDLKPYQRFLPDKWAFKLHGGEGELQGSAELTQEKFSSDIRLTSNEADVGVKDFRFQTDLDMVVKVNSPSLETGVVDVTGTYFKLNDARLSREDGDVDPWYAEIIVAKGVISLNLDEAEDGVSGVKNLAEALRSRDFKSLLA